MNKTFYMRDEDAAIWDRAREFAGDKLSPVIVDALKSYIGAKEAAAKGFERIIINFNDGNDFGIPKAKAFYGKWLIPPEEAWTASFVPETAEELYFAVAESAKGSVVVYRWLTNFGDKVFEGLRIYGSFPEAANDQTCNSAVVEAMRRRGVPVEELDI